VATAYKWHPITGLNDDPNAYTDRELEALGRVWTNQREDLIGHGGFDEFDKRLRREWSIETGIIENVYTLDRGVTLTLIEKGIDAALIPHGASDQDSTLVARIIQDHYDALEGMFDFVAGRRQLSTSYVKELHAALLRNQNTHTVVDQFGQAFEQSLAKGQYKTTPNSPTRPDGQIHEYCPPEHVAAEMDRLISMHAEYEARRIPPEVHAAWLHHRFTQIHPFSDGNGRVARAIASLVFIKAGWFPLIIKRDDWVRYVGALEKADGDDLRPLVTMFVEAQRNAFIQATEAAYDVRPISTVDEAVAAIYERLLQRGKLPVRELLEAKNTANKLAHSARERLEQIAQQLGKELGPTRSVSFSLASDLNAWFPDSPMQAAVQEAGYVANFNEYSAGLQLHLTAEMRTDLLMFSFHAVGPRYRGLIGVLAYVVVGSKSWLLEGGSFQINYEEDFTSAQGRFTAWLERMIIEGLSEWRRSL
jgi:Fic family protein